MDAYIPARLFAPAPIVTYGPRTDYPAVAPNAAPIEHEGRNVGLVFAPPRRRAGKAPRPNGALPPTPTPLRFATGEAIGPVDAYACAAAVCSGRADAWVRAVAARILGAWTAAEAEYAPVPRKGRTDACDRLASDVGSVVWERTVGRMNRDDAEDPVAHPLRAIYSACRDVRRHDQRAGGRPTDRPSSYAKDGAQEMAAFELLARRAFAARMARREGFEPTADIPVDVAVDVALAVELHDDDASDGPSRAVVARLRRRAVCRAAFAAALRTALTD
jgi:hypothetical protein